jgi:hypothetical protein
MSTQEEKMGSGKYKGKWTFGLLWIIVNTFSWGIFVALGGVSGWVAWQSYQYFSRGRGVPFLGDESNRILIALVILGLSWGAIIGLLQYSVLKRHLNLRGRKWILATIIGITIYLLSIDFLSAFAANIRLSMGFLNVVSGIHKFTSWLALGLAQWFILRHHFTKSGWWVVTTVIALGFSTFLTSTFFRTGGRNFLPNTIISSSIEGLIYGVSTLIVLTFFFGQTVNAVDKD